MSELRRDSITDDAFIVGEAFERDAVRATALDEVIDPFAIARGEVQPEAPIRFVKAEGRRLLDYIGTTHVALVLISPRFQEVLEDHGFTGWSTYDVELDSAAGYRGL